MRLGIDLGGTKIEIVALDGGGHVRLRERTATPSGYENILRAIHNLVVSAEARLGVWGSLGVAIPGTLSARTGLVKNANSTALIGHPLDKDLAQLLDRPVRLANDANCFALSEATDGAAKEGRVVFGIIAGTGIGGGVCFDGRLIEGAHLIAGEWGHNPLPAPRPDEMNGPECYCGRSGCIETWISGPALARQFAKRTGKAMQPAEIALAAAGGERVAAELMEDFYDRFARSIASIVNILDPDVIVLGGGLSNITALTGELPRRVEFYAFTPESPTRIVRNLHGDSSGVRGAAWLWHGGELTDV
ncbi:MAG TPA: ROK family protein [Rhizomicrobium sp.]|jgi:fructokinase|nr:ROK family protein [Rhizomicrobium sp.]